MCLAIPGRITAITDDDPLTRSGNVAFGGIVKSINLAFVPEAAVGDYILAHVGIAIGVIDEAAAEATLAELRSLGEH